MQTLWAMAVAMAVLAQAGSWAEQVPAQPKIRLRAAVATFHNATPIRGREIGRRAAEWTQRILAESGRWDMLPRQAVEKAEARLGLQTPLAVADLQRLAIDVGAQIIVSGVITRCKLAAGRVAVSCMIELTEPQTGELCGRASASGSAAAPRRRPLPTDILLDRAIEAACRRALRLLLRAPYGVARVLQVREESAVLDQGPRQGFAKGRLVIVAAAAEGGKGLEILGLARVSGHIDRYSTISFPASMPVRQGCIAIAP